MARGGGGVLVACVDDGVAAEVARAAGGGRRRGAAVALRGVELGRDAKIARCDLVLAPREADEARKAAVVVHALARGVPVMRPEWVQVCQERGSWTASEMDEIERFSVFDEATRLRATDNKALQGCKVALAKELGKEKLAQARALVKVAKGTVVARKTGALVVAPDGRAEALTPEQVTISFEDLLERIIQNASPQDQPSSPNPAEEAAETVAEKAAEETAETAAEEAVEKAAENAQPEGPAEELAATPGRRSSEPSEETPSSRPSVPESERRDGAVSNPKALTENAELRIASSGLPVAEKEVVLQTVRRIGASQRAQGKLVESELALEATHIIVPTMERPKRTVKVMCAIARGAWVVHASWLYESLERGHWVDELAHEAVDRFPGCRIMRERKEAGTHADALLHGAKVFLATRTSPPPRVLRRIVLSAHGQIAKDRDAADLVLGGPGKPETWLFDAIESGLVCDVPTNKRRDASASRAKASKAPSRAQPASDPPARSSSQKRQRAPKKKPLPLTFDDVFESPPKRRSVQKKKAGARKSTSSASTSTSRASAAADGDSASDSSESFEDPCASPII